MPYRYNNIYANVKGWTKISISSPSDTASWLDGDVINVGSPLGPSFVFRLSSTLFLDDQFSGTLYSAVSPTSSQSSPQYHPKAGTGNYVFGSASRAFGYYGDESPGFSGSIRDVVPTANDFMVIDADVTAFVTGGVRLYNNRLTAPPTGVNFTSSWVNLTNTAISASAASGFAGFYNADFSKFFIYAFGGTIGAGYGNDILFCSCSVRAGNSTLLDVSPWFRQDGNGNAWQWQASASTGFPSPGGQALTIPIYIGALAAAYDSGTSTIYALGGSKKPWSGATGDVSGSDQAFAWRISPATGLITGSCFLNSRMPHGRFNNDAAVAGGYLYAIGGASGALRTPAPIDRAFILNDGTLTDWETCVYDVPLGTNGMGGYIDGAVVFYPDPTVSPVNASRSLTIVGGLKQFVTASAPGYNVSGSAQIYSAPIILTPGAFQLANPNKIGIDPAWQGPAPGEAQTLGAQLGPSDIRPVLPLLDNVYQQLVVQGLPSGSQSFAPGTKILGYRPGLKGTEINGTWTLKFATTPGAFLPTGDLTVDHWASMTASQVYFRQARLEFVVDTAGFADIQYFNPARERLYKKSSLGARNGKRLIDIISGSTWWDSGVSYIYSYIGSEYGRTVGITDSSGSDDYAVFTQITGVLADYLSGTPDWYLNPPPGEGMPGLPYIPMSSASFGEASVPLTNIGSSADMIRATVDPQLPIPADDTIDAYLSRIQAIRTTQAAYEAELLRQSLTGSGF